MTVGELKKRLEGFSDDETVIVNVRVHSQAFGVARPTPWDVDHQYSSCTIEVTLPDNMHVVTRKK